MDQITIEAATIITLVSAVITVTGMFVTLRERVKNHEERLQYHSQEINKLSVTESANQTQFAEIKQILNHLKEMLDDMRKGRGCYDDHATGRSI